LKVIEVETPTISATEKNLQAGFADDANSEAYSHNHAMSTVGLASD